MLLYLCVLPVLLIAIIFVGFLVGVGFSLGMAFGWFANTLIVDFLSENSSANR